MRVALFALLLAFPVLALADITATGTIVDNDSTGAQAGEFKVTFDAWPNTSASGTEGCGSFSGGSAFNRPECEGHLVLNADVNSFSGQCRGGTGKCWRGVYGGNEDSHYFKPCSEANQCSATGFTGQWSIPSAAGGGGGNTALIRYWIKFGTDFSGCASSCFGTGGQQLKTLRIIGPGGTIPFAGFRGSGTGEFEEDLSGCTTNPNLTGHINEWLRFVMFVDTGTDAIKLWAYDSAGTLLDSCTDSASMSGALQRTAWVMGNFSTSAGWPPGGGSSTRTVYMDDLCFGRTESANTGYCAN
jgi:hypothetical protein